MKAHFPISVALLAPFLLAASPLSPHDRDPENVVAQFYSLTMRYNATAAVPTDAGQTTLERLLTPALMKAVEDAQRADKQYSRKTKFQKAPLIDGDLFSSLYEGPTAVKSTSCIANDAVLRCPVSLASNAVPGQPTIRWTDTLVLAKAVDGWRVDDIEFGGAPPEGRKGKLTDFLKEVVVKANQPGG